LESEQSVKLFLEVGSGEGGKEVVGGVVLVGLVVVVVKES